MSEWNADMDAAPDLSRWVTPAPAPVFRLLSGFLSGRNDIAVHEADDGLHLYVRNAAGAWDRVREIKVLGLEGWE